MGKTVLTHAWCRSSPLSKQSCRHCRVCAAQEPSAPGKVICDVLEWLDNLDKCKRLRTHSARVRYSDTIQVTVESVKKGNTSSRLQRL
ncbi:hypothetical protein F2P81_026123 [Scophthalmus maximus]|uniref:Uncharacterized protein n=1 Tax=Scophthalmus maximus TaxID=52904 RepID=A0A6A4RSN8_SCOMX|nr:hypothetical protein F2P81_026123 [Scophthalmus maximus]